MFSRWGAFVYRHRRIVLVLAIVVGVIGASAAGRAASVLSAGGWLDPGSESAAVANRLADEFGAGRGALIAVYRGADGDGRPQRRVPGSHRGVARRPRQGSRRVGDHRLRRDGRRPVHLQRRPVGLRRRRPQRHRRGVGPADRPVRVGDPRAHRRHQAAARRLRGADPRLDRPVRAGPGPRRDGLPPHRRLRPDPGVHVADLGRHPAARGRPRDPDHARARVRRRPAGRDERLRLERVDDAGARARDRLLAVHGQPVPRGAEEGTRRRQRRRDRRRHVRQGRHVLGPRGRHRARRPAGVQRPGAPLVRHRRDADGVRVPVLRHDLPAGAARHPRTEGQLAVGDRPDRPHPARAGPPVERAGGGLPALPLGVDRQHRHGPPRRRHHPDPVAAAARRPPVPPPPAGHPRRLHAARGPREPRGGRRDPVGLRGRHDRADRRPRRRPRRSHVRGQRPRARRVRPGPGRRVRRRAGREPVHRHPQPGNRPAAHRRRARGPVRPTAGRVAAAARRPCGTGTSTRPPSASTPSARSSRRRRPGPRWWPPPATSIPGRASRR